MSTVFYIQNTRWCGNTMVWWKHNGYGYVTYIREAKVFSAEESKKICDRPHTNKRRWPKDYIDARIEHHIVNMQRCDIGEALGQVEEPTP